MASVIGSDKTSVQAKMQDNLADFGSLTRQMVESFGGSGKPTQDMQVVQEILQKILSRDKEIQLLADSAVKMCEVQTEVVCVEDELGTRRQQVAHLQAKLHEAEKILEMAVYRGRQKVQAIESAEKGAVNPDELIKYAHRISQASSVVSPVGWKLSDQQRPFPQDIEMRCGFLGELTSGIKPRPPDAMREGLMPPEKKPALDSSHAGIASAAAGVLPKKKTLVGVVGPEPELMSEDSSASSDEGN